MHLHSLRFSEILYTHDQYRGSTSCNFYDYSERGREGGFGELSTCVSLERGPGAHSCRSLERWLVDGWLVGPLGREIWLQSTGSACSRTSVPALLTSLNIHIISRDNNPERESSLVSSATTGSCRRWRRREPPPRKARPSLSNGTGASPPC
jgi:hypothetical protein